MGGMQTVRPKVADRWKKDGGWSWGMELGGGGGE